MTTFKEFADVCEEIEGISSSLEITAVVSALLQQISESSDPDAELSIVSRFVMGKVFPDWSAVELGVGPSLLYESISRTAGVTVKQIKQLIRETGDVGEAARVALETGVAGSSGARATQTTFLDFTDGSVGDDDGGSGDGKGGSGADGHLTIVEVFERMLSIAQASGKGSQQIKIKNLQYLFGTASPIESRYIARIVLEELRIGVGEGLVRNAIAQAFGEDAGAVERSYMLINDLGEVAVTAFHHDLEQVSIMLGRPIKLMLAQIGSFDDITGAYAAEWKFDGARVQIHKDGDDVLIFSRRLEDVTKSLPDVVNMIKSQVTANQMILDGEVVATGPAGKPLAFQEIMRRFRRKYKVSAMAEKVPLHLNLFDIMYLDGEALIDEPLHVRRKRLESVVRPPGDAARISVVHTCVLTGQGSGKFRITWS